MEDNLQNAPWVIRVFITMRFMHQVLRSLIGRFIIIYFNDILIYSSTLKSHLEHLRDVFDT
jgi:hypothetical protein